MVIAYPKDRGRVGVGGKPEAPSYIESILLSRVSPEKNSVDRIFGADFLEKFGSALFGLAKA
jgi:hypothetical protein